MPSRKQRRRREKERRHDYEYVYVDSDGREVDVEPDDIEAPKPVAKSEPKRVNGKAAGSRASSSRRQVEPPSWRRSARRAAIFAPFMFITLFLLDRNASAAVKLLVTAQMLVFFIPFTYLIDRIMYRRFSGGGAKTGAGGASGARDGTRATPASRGRRTATKG